MNTRATRAFGQIHSPVDHEQYKAPRQFCEMMGGDTNRFSEICRIYLDGLSLDDVKYLQADDLINLVPPNQYKHRMLMTIMVRRYLYKESKHGVDETHDNASVCSDCHA
jgi:hypothetical protein